MESFGLCDRGKVREKNEDAIFLDDEMGIYIVADGMGGHNAGEIASRLAIDAFQKAFVKQDEGEDLPDRLVAAMAKANEAVYAESQSAEEKQGMGTTFTCAAVKKNRAVIGHVGDSRAYLFHDGTLRQITRDHSYVMEMVKQGKLTLEEAAVHPKRNIITKAVGSKEPLGSDVFFETLRQGDLLLLCSDGLTTMVEEETIATILEEQLPVEEAAHRLVDCANRHGGKDNISVILVQCEVEP